MTRFGFDIRTKTGQRVDNIRILAANLGDAERRLRQMYWHCVIIEIREQSVPHRVETLDIEGVIETVSASPSGHEPGTR